MIEQPELRGDAPREKDSQADDEQKLRKMQFTVDSETAANLETIRRIHRDPSLAQSFRRAAAVAAYIEKMRKEGYELLMKKGDEVYKIFIP